MHFETLGSHSSMRHSRGSMTCIGSRYHSRATKPTLTTSSRTHSLRAYRSWHTYLPGSDCRRWLFTICRNVFLRSRERSRPTVELESSEVDAIAIGAHYSDGGQDQSDDMFARLDLQPAIHRALARIPEPFRSTLVIVDVEDQSYESAAEVLGVPIGTVRSRLFRGRRLMQEHLLNYATDAGLRPHPVAQRELPSRLSAA